MTKKNLVTKFLQFLSKFQKEPEFYDIVYAFVLPGNVLVGRIAGWDKKDIWIYHPMSIIKVFNPIIQKEELHLIRFAPYAEFESLPFSKKYIVSYFPVDTKIGDSYDEAAKEIERFFKNPGFSQNHKEIHPPLDNESQKTDITIGNPTKNINELKLADLTKEEFDDIFLALQQDPKTKIH